MQLIYKETQMNANEIQMKSHWDITKTQSGINKITNENTYTIQIEHRELRRGMSEFCGALEPLPT